MLTENRKKILELFVLSAVSLYVELLIIRWMSADIRAFTVFRTFPLITCFVGLGVGFALGTDRNYKYTPIAILLFALLIKLADFLGVGIWGFPTLGVFQWQNLSGLIVMNAPYIVIFMLMIILLLAFPFAICVCIGARLGVLFEGLKPLTAYSANVAGAIAGSVLFPALSKFGIDPWQLLLIPLVMIGVDLVIKKEKTALVSFAGLLVIPAVFLSVPNTPALPLIPQLGMFRTNESKKLWSPYQRIDLSVFRSPATKDSPSQFLGLEVSANRAFYQYFFNTDPNGPLGKQELIESVRRDYALPFTFNKSTDVLIVGAGTGQNVSAALKAGAEHVDAVEIDPVIIDIGKKFNNDYASPKVNLICDDARHFIAETNKKYDVINFSTIDSHTVSGLGSSVRVDAYVYTKESIAKALTLLKPDGVLQLSYITFAPWMKERLFRTFQDAAGYAPIVLEARKEGTIFIFGPHVKDGTLKAPDTYKPVPIPVTSDVRELTDDWPYLYVQPDILDWPYLLVLTEIILISLFAGRNLLFGKSDASSWQMFFLGSAFMLLELHAISFLSLLYGSTWITSAIVINCILLMILVANSFVQRFNAALSKFQPAVYGALMLSILASYMLPTQSLMEHAGSNQIVTYSLMAFVTVLPMGLAAIIFASAFSKAPNVSKALAFNLFGAVVGGMLEYLSNFIGIRSLDLVAMLLYALSFLCWTRKPAAAPTEANI